ncbi:MAG: ABC transporter ATP-binding protein/permease [Methanosarcinaceae archaeon]|jgi:ATP-binding cassette subfamily B protein|nr:ABC transporter ATP-binding protein/permease [Methanosarcinaceae archaeon]NKQ39708.1 ABC transporter ATP-binding protein [Methanosarcinales archaeon]
MNEKDSIKRLTKLCLTESNKMIVAIIFAMISFTISIIPYYMVYRVITELLIENPQINQIINYSIIAFVAIIIRITFFAIATTISHGAAFDILYKLRVQIAEKLLTLPLGYFSNKDIGAIKKTINEDVEKLELYIAHNVPEIIGAITLPIVTTIFLFFMDWRMTLATIAIIPLMMVFYGFTFKGVEVLMPKYNELLIKMNAAIIEYTNGMQVIKAFGLTASSYKKLSESCLEYGEFEADWGKATYKYFNVVSMLVNSGVIIILPVGMFFYLTGTLSMSLFILFLLVGLGYSQPLVKLITFMQIIAHMSKGEEEIHKLLNEKSLEEPQNPQNPIGHNIEFVKVDFAYEDKQILNEVSFVAKQNEITALVGPSGAGKTTIARLIPRFWDVHAGEIKIGGVNIKNMSTEKLMDMVSFVFQDVFLFNVSIKDNIRFGKDGANDEEVLSAAKAAQCHEFIIKLPNGYDTLVGQRGTKLSGGEKQRIALARAILKDAPIIIFDEATSATDPENEDKIQEAVSKLIKNKTVIVIAHNLSTIIDANRIILVENGKTEKYGKHSKLLEESNTYKNMWETHVKSNELILVGGKANV